MMIYNIIITALTLALIFFIETMQYRRNLRKALKDVFIIIFKFTFANSIFTLEHYAESISFLILTASQNQGLSRVSA